MPGVDSVAAGKMPQSIGATTGAASTPALPVFVVGCYRSGTTLMENVLARHGGFATLGFETHFFTHVLRHKRLPDFNREHWRKPLGQQFGVDDWDGVQGDRLEAYRRLMSQLATENNQRFWLEKTPDHLFDVERIRERLPGARFVCMLRDGRDVAASVVHAPYILPRIKERRHRLIAACALWEWMTAETLRRAAEGRDDFLLVRYETLVQSPAEALTRVARFLGLDASAGEVSLWLGRLRDVEGNSSFGNIVGIDAGAARRWKGQARLAPDETSLVERLTGATLRAAGYADQDTPRGRAPVGARLERAMWLCTRFVRGTATHGQAWRGAQNLMHLSRGGLAQLTSV